MSENFKDKSKVAVSKRRDYENIEHSHLNEKHEYELILDELGNDSSYKSLIEYALSKKPIKDEEKVRKLIESAQKGNINDRNLLLETNLRAVLHIIRKYFRSNGQIEDMIQEGNLGIIEAIEKFDLKAPNKFSTFMYRVVISKIHSYLRTITPTMTYNPPSKRLKKYISTTELNDLVRNFVDIRDLRARIWHFSESIQVLIEEYVVDKLITVISFEENEDEVLKEIHSSTQREFVSLPNFSYMFALETFQKKLKYCALAHTSKKNYELFLKVSGLFGYIEPINLNKYLKEIGINPKTFGVFKQKFIMNVFDNREYRDFLKTYIDKVIEARSYYYEEIWI